MKITPALISKVEGKKIGVHLKEGSYVHGVVIEITPEYIELLSAGRVGSTAASILEDKREIVDTDMIHRITMCPEKSTTLP